MFFCVKDAVIFTHGGNIKAKLQGHSIYAKRLIF